MTTFDQVIRSAVASARLFAEIAAGQRTMEQVCRGSVARLVAGDRPAAGLVRLGSVARPMAADRSAAGLVLSGLWPRPVVPCEQEEAARCG